MNFRRVSARLRDRVFIIGPNASGKSNFLDAFKFLRDIAQGSDIAQGGAGGGLSSALRRRGGIKAIRCLAARKEPTVEIDVHLASDADSAVEWRYALGIRNEGKGSNRDLVAFERVWHGEELVVNRPDTDDKADPERLTQTHLQQISSNRKFRPLVEFFASTTYLHLVPQLLKYSEQLGGYRIEGDPFGQAFLERVAGASDRVRDSRLRRINDALRVCVPQLRDLQFVKDPTTGRPHLEALYEHWRPNAGWQRESQFSDGTLRLLGLLWVLLEGDSLLLLEEPELSLNDAIVEQIPGLVRRMQRVARSRRQVLITTHSEALLRQEGVDAREVVRLVPSKEGTTVAELSSDDVAAIRAGLTVADVLLPKARPAQSGKLQLLDDSSQ